MPVRVVHVWTGPYDVPTGDVAYALTLYVVEGVRSLRVLVNEPVPEPSIVVSFAMVGIVGLTAQQTPRLVTVLPPDAETLPPLTAVV